MGKWERNRFAPLRAASELSFPVCRFSTFPCSASIHYMASNSASRTQRPAHSRPLFYTSPEGKAPEFSPHAGSFNSRLETAEVSTLIFAHNLHPAARRKRGHASFRRQAVPHDRERAETGTFYISYAPPSRGPFGLGEGDIHCALLVPAGQVRQGRRSAWAARTRARSLEREHGGRLCDPKRKCLQAVRPCLGVGGAVGCWRAEEAWR